MEPSTQAAIVAIALSAIALIVGARIWLHDRRVREEIKAEIEKRAGGPVHIEVAERAHVMLLRMVETVEKRNDALRAQLNEVIETHGKQLAEQRRLLYDYERRADEMDLERERGKAHADQLEWKLVSAEGKLERQGKAIEALTSDRERLRAERDEAVVTAAKAEERAKKAENEAKRLRARVTTLEEEMVALREHVATLENRSAPAPPPGTEGQ